MAPHRFWLKRQIGLDVPDLPIFGDDEDETDPRPVPGSSSGTPSSSESSTPVESQTSTLSSTSYTSPSLSTPVPSSISEDDGDEQEANPVQSSGTPVAPNLSSTPATALSTPLSDGQSTRTFIRASTLVVDGGASVETGTPENVGGSKNAFLENKVLSGIVFGLCGLVGLVLLIIFVFFVTRKARRNRKLEREIISWDPDHVHTFSKKDEDGRSIQDLEEKGRLSPSGSQQGHFAYALPSKTTLTSTNSSAPAPYSDYGQPVPIHVAFPVTGDGGQQQPYRPPW